MNISYRVKLLTEFEPVHPRVKDVHDGSLSPRRTCASAGGPHLSSLTGKSTPSHDGEVLVRIQSRERGPWPQLNTPKRRRHTLCPRHGLLGPITQPARVPACRAGRYGFESRWGRTESSAAGTLCILLRGLVLSPAGLAALSGRIASWRKRQTQRFQAPPPSPACGFESHRGYGPEKTTGRYPRRKSDRGPGSRKRRAASVQAVPENLHRRQAALRGTEA